MIYTSGHTGIPKAVIGTHAGTVNRALWYQEELPFDHESEALVAKTSISAIGGNMELFSGLLSGATVLLATGAEAQSISGLARLSSSRPRSRMTVVPSLLDEILDKDSPAPAVKCRLWMSSGEELTRRTLIASGTSCRA